MHIELFHMDDVTGWAWLALYGVFPPAVMVLLARQVRVAGVEPPRADPMARPLLGLLAAQGAVMVALGTALVIAPLDAASLWPWELTALTGRAIGVFVLAQGALVLTACRERDWGRARPAMIQYALLGALHLGALLRFRDTLDWDTAGAWLYLAFLLSVLAVGGYGCRRALLSRHA